MNNIVIVVEGKSDLIFIRDIIIKNYNFELTQDLTKKKEEVVFQQDNKKLILKVAKQNENINSKGGWGELKGLIPQLKDQFPKLDFKLLIIFDSDNTKSDNIEHKKTLIDIWCKELNYEMFYLPYNKVDEFDDLEDLILTCVTEKFGFFYKCWDEFMKCLDSNFIGKINYPDKKRKIFTLKDSFEKIHPELHTSYLIDDVWDIEFKKNNKLNDLKDFLDKNIL